MKLLFDSNVWVAAFGTHGLCKQLVEQAIVLDEAAAIELVLCPAVRQEVMRILEHKFRLGMDELARARRILSEIATVPDGVWQPADAFPDPDDVPIIGAALAVGVDLFVTGDKALLELGEVEGLSIVTPRTAFLKLPAFE